MPYGNLAEEFKNYQSSVRNLKDEIVLIFKSMKSIYKHTKSLKSAIKNLTSIYKSVIKELARAESLQKQGKIVDHSYYSALKNLKLALRYQHQAEDRISQIPSFESLACLLKQATEYLNFSFLHLVRALKMLKRK